jgi:hypothetical protein
MQYPGCQTLKRSEMLNQIKSAKSNAKDDMRASNCINSIPPILDTFDQLRYNSESKLSGIYSFSKANNEIHFNLVTESYIKIYIEYLEESYINKRIPFLVFKKVKGKPMRLARSLEIQAPGLSSEEPLRRGEYLEFKLDSSVNNDDIDGYFVRFGIRNILNDTNLYMSNRN